MKSLSSSIMAKYNSASEIIPCFAKSVELYIWTALTQERFKAGLRPLVPCKDMEKVAEEHLDKKIFKRHLKGNGRIEILKTDQTIFFLNVEKPSNIQFEKGICEEAFRLLASACRDTFLQDLKYKGAIVSEQVGETIHLVVVIQ